MTIKFLKIKKFTCKMPAFHEVSSDNLILPDVKIYLPSLSSLTPTVHYNWRSLEKVKMQIYGVCHCRRTV